MVEAYEENTSDIVPESALSKAGGAVAGFGKFFAWLTGNPITGWFSSWVFAPVAGFLVAVGDGLKVVDAAADGNMKKAGTLAAQGAAETAVTVVNAPFAMLTDTIAKPLTGYTVAGNAGNIAARLVDGIDKNMPQKTNTASVGWNPAYVQAVEANGGSVPPMVPSTFWRDQVKGSRVPQPAQDIPPVTSGNPAYASAVERLAAEQPTIPTNPEAPRAS